MRVSRILMIQLAILNWNLSDLWFKPSEQAYVAKSSSRKTFGFKHNKKFFKKNKKSNDASNKGKFGACKKFKHAKSEKCKLKYYNYGNKAHFVHECTMPKQVWSCSNNSCVYVSSYVMLTKYFIYSL